MYNLYRQSQPPKSFTCLESHTRVSCCSCAAHISPCTRLDRSWTDFPFVRGSFSQPLKSPSNERLGNACQCNHFESKAQVCTTAILVCPTVIDGSYLVPTLTPSLYTCPILLQSFSVGEPETRESLLLGLLGEIGHRKSHDMKGKPGLMLLCCSVRFASTKAWERLNTTPNTTR